MAVETRKRKASGSPDDSSKRLRIERPHSAPESSTPPRSEYDESDDGFCKTEDDSFDAGGLQDIHTPITPSSPTRAKYPSQLKTIACTWPDCDKTFNRPARLATHLLKHEGKKTFICSYEGCDKAYFEQKHLTSHIKGSHVQERAYSCDWADCRKSFLTATRLKRHKEAHQGHERFRCIEYPPCNQTFRKHQTLQRHIRADHLDVYPFPCTHVDALTNEACDIGFDTASKLKRHRDQVHGIPKFFCDQCTISGQANSDGNPAQVGFSTKAKLQAHLKSSHANCHFCDRKCSSQRELQKHIETQHSGTSLEDRKTISCTYAGCLKKFTKKSNLNSHIRTAHKGERWICGTTDITDVEELSLWDLDEGCGKDFVTKANLADHVRTAHLGLPSLINRNRRATSFVEDDELEQKPKKQKCRKAPNPSRLDELLGTAYNDERRSIPCIVPTCNYKFMREYDLQNHIRSKHHLGTPEIADLEQELLMGDAFLEQNGMAEGVFSEQAPMDALYGGTDFDWEIQRRVIEGEPFWVGGEEQDNLGNVEWAQDECEMRRLIDQEMALDPSLPGL
ncbi:hypothetical protein BP6252_07698 [Coleophoma cylindrospora]|uniref:C2H2-type domain-containing protein n=1 Tax=Coleophoma cylindrospora TaxID=1849047 RepID=A0A3D8RAU9_9HELO|nr:hypothetical protein BP6252_07698 [Coleophoma cylindrospora]